MTLPRVLIIAIIAVFMLVTVGHVATYAGSFEAEDHALLGLPYAIAVNAAIVVCAMLTRHDKTAGWAWVGYFVFTVADGLMNAAAVEPWNAEAPFFAWVYALSPTLAIGLLGFLARQADAVAESLRIKHAAEAQAERERQERDAEARRLRDERNAERREMRRLARIDAQAAEALGASGTSDAQPAAQGQQPAPPPAPTPANFDNAAQLAANMNGNRASLTGRALNEMLTAAGFAAVPDSTARYWAGKIRGGAR